MEEEDKRKLDDSVIHTTVFRQDQPEDDNQSVYEVFERINTGGVKLSAQEIRACVSFGDFTDLLRELNGTAEWREIYGSKSVRLKDEELILRFLAFLHNREKYARPLSGFLNTFLADNRYIDQTKQMHFGGNFIETIRFVASHIGRRAFRPERALNTAVFDAVMVGLAVRLRSGEMAKPEEAGAIYDELVGNPDFQTAYKRSTADEEQVRLRLRLAIEAFGGNYLVDVPSGAR